MTPRTQEQIRLLQEEKRSRTPAQRKLDSQLLYALRQKRAGSAAPGVNTLRPALRPEPDGEILVDITADVTPDLVRAIRTEGGSVLSTFPRYRAIRAKLSLELIETLAARPQVRSIRPADQAITNTGPTPSDGAIAHQADLAWASFGIDGTGVKVGVLSDSADFLAGLQTVGQMPTVTILPGQDGVGSGEGTAMLEIIHGVAPGAQLYFATAFGGLASFAQNIQDLQAAGCQIIVDDVTYFVESPFQDGPVAQAVQEVSALGTLYFSSAGNSGNVDKGTAGTWEGDFHDGGPATIGRGGRVHDFGGSTFNTVLAGGSVRRVDLFWADPLGQSTNDYDVYVLDSTGAVVRSSTNVQDGTGDPYETIPALNVGEQIVIVKFAGEDRFLSLHTGRARLSLATSGATRGHNACEAPNAFCVAATRVTSPPAPFLGGTNNPVESFSSDGPRHMFFNPDGSAITPGNYSASGGRVLSKPDLTAADGVTTSVPGFGTFLGTSAAAPHAAAVAALLLAYSPTLSPALVRQVLSSTSLDIEAPGPDRDSGAGIVMAYPALAAAPRLEADLVQMNDANGNGSLDPNECADLWLRVQNKASVFGQTWLGVSGVLESANPGVVVDPAPRAFSDLDPGGSAASGSAFRVSTAASLQCGTPVNFLLRLAATNQSPVQLPVQLISHAAGVAPPQAFSSTDTPLAIPDLGVAQSSVAVSGLPLPLGQVRVKLYLTHPFDYDLRLTLIGPDATQVLLSANNGGAGQDYGLGCDNPTVFADDAATSIDLGLAPFVGAYLPDQPLAAFAGMSPGLANGLWTLRAEDDVAQDSGTLQCWQLELATISCFDGGGQCLVPPAVAQSPTDQVATNGDTVVFSVGASGAPPLTYQWLFNQTNLLADATNSSLVLSNVTPSQAGTYSALVSNPYGSIASGSGQLTVMVRPFIVSNPSDQITTNGGTVTLAVAAQGSDPLAFQWFHGNQPLAGATLDTLVLNNVGLGQSGSYSAMVSNPYGNALSASAQVTVLTAPLIVNAPTNLVATNGDTVYLSVSAQGVGPLSYQWILDQTNLLAAATNSVLVLTNVTPAQAGGYSVQVLNQYGAALSDPAQVVVVLPPVILSSPQDQLVTYGATASLSVEAAGTGPLSYQWYFQGNQAVNGATDATLVTQSASSLQAGSYAVLVSSPYGSALSAPAQLRVFAPPVILADLADTLAAVGAIPVFTILAQSSEPMSYTWYFNNTNLLTVSGPAGASLALTNVSLPEAGTYRVVVDNQHGSTSSRLATLTVGLAPAILTNPSGQIATNGGTVSLDVQASGTAPLSYQWYFQGGQLLAGATTNQLVINNVAPAQAGNYSVLVSNAFGSTNSAPAQLSVLTAPDIVTSPTNVLATNGDAVFLSVSAQGSPPLAFQWYLNQTNLLADQTNSLLVLSNVAPSQSGGYSAVVSNPYGSTDSDTGQLLVVVPPLIVSDPVGLVATNGDTVTLTVGAEGTDPLFYQWYFQGDQLLAGATDATLVLNNIGVGQAGTYSAVATSPYGSADSATALVTVVTAPVVVTDPTNVLATNGDTVFLSVNAQGSKPLAYQWYLYQTNLLMDQTNAALVLSNVAPAQAGPYTVIVSNPYGTAQSATGQVTVVSLPVIVSNPQDQVLTNGDPLTLSVEAQGTAPLSYQWYFQDSQLLDGATDASLLISHISPAQAGSYSVSVSNPYGTASSTRAQVTVLAAPLVVSSPTNVLATNGDTVFLGVNALGSPPMAFQWFFNQTNILADGTNSLLVLSNATPAQAGAYSAIVSNPYGSALSDTSQVAVVVPPMIVSNPVDQVLTNGGTATLSVGAQGTDPLSYQWYFQGNQLLAGQTDAILTINNVGPGQNGSYLTVVSNPYGSATSAPAQLTVLSPPVVLGSPTNALATNGDAVYLSVTAQGSQPLTYQWFFNQTNSLTGQTNSLLVLSNATPAQAGAYSAIVSNPYGSANSDTGQVTVVVPPVILNSPVDQVVSNGTTVTLSVNAQGTDPLSYQWYFQSNQLLPGATDATLIINSIGVGQAGAYSAAVSNPYGIASSAPAQVTVLGPPLLLGGPTNVVATNGDTVYLSVNALGPQPLAYQWFFNQTNLLTDATNSLLVLTNVSPFQAGAYSVVASNPYGSASSDTGTVTVVVPPFIVTNPVDQVATNGATVVLSVEATGSDPLSYQWYFQGSQLAGATDTTLVLGPVNSLQAGNYTAMASNPYGNTTSAPALVRVLAPPAIVVSPTDTVAVAGATVTITVVARSSEPLIYTWFKDNQPLESVIGPAGATLLLTNVGLAQAGTYAVSVGNQYGSVATSATLKVLVPPAITCASNRTVELGAAWDFTPPTVGDPTVTTSLLSTSTNLGCGNTFSATRTWVATATNGVQVSCSQTITLVDTTPPVLTVTPARTVSYGSAWAFDSPVASDVGAPQPGAGVTISILSTLTNVDCGNSMTATRTWQGTDGCGNTTLCTQTVAVVDSTPPILLSQPQDQVVVQGGTVSFGVVVSNCPSALYQWYFNGTNPIVGAYLSVLTLTNTTLAQSGAYTVGVSNAFAGTVSRSAQLRVLVKPELLSLSRSGDLVSLSFSTIPGLIYSVYYSEDITSSNWTQLPKFSGLVGTGAPIAAQDPRSPAAWRWYKIVAQ